MIDAEDVTQAERCYEQQRLRAWVIELAGDRVLDFAGAPGAQMQCAGRLCGQCFNCWKELTDPVSLELGIGPDCLDRKVRYIRWAKREGHRVERIAFLSGMPLEFVNATSPDEVQRTAIRRPKPDSDKLKAYGPQSLIRGLDDIRFKLRR